MAERTRDVERREQRNGEGRKERKLERTDR